MENSYCQQIPTALTELAPFNHKRISRLSRMSGVSEEEVTDIFDIEYKKLKNQVNNSKINKALFDGEMLKQLYVNVMQLLGIQSQALTLSSFTSFSHIHGFNLATAETYLLEIGYEKKFVQSLKISPEFNLITYPKYLDNKFKKEFEFFFEKVVLKNEFHNTHPIIFYAKTLAEFITKLSKENKNPFSPLVKGARNAPLSSLLSLYDYKFNVVLRYVSSLYGFKINKIAKSKESFSLVLSKLSNFSSYGSITLKSDDFSKSVNKLKIGKKLLQGNTLHFHTEKGVDILIEIKNKELTVKYRIKIDTHFRTYGVTDIHRWITQNVILPCVKPSLRLRNTIKGI